MAKTPVPLPPVPRTKSLDPPLDDRALVAHLVAGDAAAWRTLVERFQRLVLSRVLATARELNWSLAQLDAEDLSAEVFSRLIADDYAALRRFEGRSTLSTWLSVVTRRIVVRRLTVAGREPSHPTAEAPLAALSGPTNAEPLNSLIGEEDRALLAAGISQLGERQRELARLYYFEKQSYREISQQLGMPMNSVGPTLARIHEKLRAGMKQEE